jgi:hypothetical protein
MSPTFCGVCPACVAKQRRRAVKVTFADGNTLTTEINGTEEEIRAYYLNNEFQFGDTDERPKDNLQRATKVEFLGS